MTPEETAIRAAFAQRIACYDTPSPLDWAGIGLAADPLQQQLTGKDEVALSRFLMPGTLNGQPAAVFTVIRLPITTLAGRYGLLFAAGKPTAAAFLAACAALHPLGQVGLCAICRYTDKFKAEGILA